MTVLLKVSDDKAFSLVRFPGSFSSFTMLWLATAAALSLAGLRPKWPALQALQVLGRPLRRPEARGMATRSARAPSTVTLTGEGPLCRFYATG